MVLQENLFVIVASIQEGATDVGVGVVGGPARGADVVHGGLRVVERYVTVFFRRFNYFRYMVMILPK